MKILLINNNPVVSRLTALSARKEDIEIDEIQEVTELSSDTYDIVFVDADSWTKDVRDIITDNIKTQKSVLFYGDGDEEEKESFDISILKPFLPSEVSAVIRSIEEKSENETTLEKEEINFNILDDAQREDRDELFTLDKIDEKKEIENVSFDDKLEESFPLKLNTLDDDLFEDESKIELNIEDGIVNEKLDKKVKEDIELFDLDLSDEIPSLEDDLFAENKKDETLEIMEKFDLDDDTLEISKGLEEDSSFLSIDEELALEVSEPVQKETKILDELEIENIKGILTDDSSNDMSLEDLMPPMALMPSLEKEEDKREERTQEEEVKVNDALNIDSNVLGQTLAAMPVENLRHLLAGATVNIKIKFPKSKK